MCRDSRIRSLLSFLILLPFLPAWAAAETCFHLDFDTDNDPWTISNQAPSGVTEATFRIILEVPAGPTLPAGSPFHFVIDEGCCDDFISMGHYGAHVDPASLTFDPAFVTGFEENFATCTCCTPWLVDGSFASDAPMQPGQRYFIGQAVARAECPDVYPYCQPTTDFTVIFEGVQGCSRSESWMGFQCPTTAVPMPPPSIGTWGKIKSLYSRD